MAWQDDNEPDETDLDPLDFKTIREQLRYWPYTTHQIEDTLDIALIEGKGRQLLFQAINARNLTAFVGSGLSASYGRLTWRDWEHEQMEVVKHSRDAFRKLTKASLELLKALEPLVHPGMRDDPEPEYATVVGAARDGEHLGQAGCYNIWRWLRFRQRQITGAQQQVERLAATFERTKNGADGFPDGEQLPLKFQVAQQLHNQLRNDMRLFLPELPETDKDDRDTKEKCWPGARIDQENVAPEKALKALKELIDKHSISKIELLRDTFDKALDKYILAFNRQQAAVTAEDLAKMLLFDERAHAMITLRKGLEPAATRAPDRNFHVEIGQLEKHLDIYRRSVLRRDIAGIRNDPKLYRVLSAFRFDALWSLDAKIRDEAEKNVVDWAPFLDSISVWFRDYLTTADKVGDTRKFLSPSDRFLIATYLSLLDNPWSLVLPEGAGDLDKSTLLPKLKRSDFTSRRSIMANRFDPLAKTVHRLGIKRYITMNYDLEIERFFMDMGYRKFPAGADGSGVQTASVDPAPDAFRSDPTGGVLIDQTFDRTKAAELTAFAIDDNRRDAAVFHLHGRATQTDSLVITERDYMNLYLLEDKHRDTVNEAITMAFSSSPLIFLGLGMNEADLLRPLRQFMSNRDRIIGYNAVAILPAEKDIEARTKFSVTCFLRYGIHTIFYGSGQVAAEERGCGPLGVDWLCRMFALIKALNEEVKTLQDSGERNAPDRVFARLAAKVGHISGDIGGYPDKYTLALTVLLGRIVSSNGNLKDFHGNDETASAARDIMEGRAALKVCEFTPIRPSHHVKHSRHYSPKLHIDGSDYVGLPTKILTEALRIVLRLHASGAATPRIRRDLDALKITLDGVYGALLTGALNAQLVALEAEWRVWWQNWQQSPPHRQPRFQRLADKVRSEDPGVFPTARYIRHRVDSIITKITEGANAFVAEWPIEEDGAGGSRIKPHYQTRLRAFDTFVLSLCAIAKNPKGRLLLTVAAYRGLGKGSFLTAMSSRLGLSLYSEVAWPEPENAEPRPFLVSACFINLSFSTEIASCYDGLMHELGRLCAALEAARCDIESGASPAEARRRLAATVSPGSCDDVSPYGGESGDERFGENATLSDILNIEIETRGASRLKIIETLFGKFKTLSDKLASPAFGRPRFLLYLSGLELIYERDCRPKNAEIKRLLDMIFSDDANRVPMDVILVASENNLGAPFSLPAKQRRFEQRLVPLTSGKLRATEHIQRRALEGNISIDAGAGKPDLESSINWVHFARPGSPASLLCDNFPVLATALYLLNPPATDPDKRQEIETAGKLFEAAVRKGMVASDEDMAALWTRPLLPAAGELDAARKRVWEHVWVGCHRAICAHGAALHQFEQDDTANNNEQRMRHVLRYRLKLDGSEERAEWRRIRRHIGYNRFMTTLLLAAAEHIVIHAPSPKEGAWDAQEFIRTTTDQLRAVGMDRRDELILQTVLDRYRRYHVVGDPDLDVELHQLIMRHLGVIGSPVSSAVLVRLPEFRAYFRRVGDELPTSRRRFLARALTVMAYRGLIFRIDPHPRQVMLAERLGDDDRHWPAREDYRFAMHRSVQSYALSKIGVGQIDPVVSNSFAPRLYASMPSIGTGLSMESYTFIRTLLLGLSQYPDIPSTDTNLIPWLFTTRHVTVKAQALRAALALVRSTLSVATLSRFPTRQSADTISKGVLENYKIRLRWIIRMAWGMVDHKQDGTYIRPSRRNQKAESSHINPLYRDEIVWLYNELGVVTLTQGNLTEALGFLRQAADFNEEIEGLSRFGPIYEHIDLNHAIVQLERGRLQSAAQRLNRLAKSKHKQSTVREIARGYQCVLGHIRGEFDGLKDKFDAVINELQRLDDRRASAIFLSHRARFLAVVHDPDAADQLQRARALAETGGHEDVRHHIEIAQLTVKFRSKTDSVDNAGMLRQLADTEAYSRRMGIWSLQVDALKLRAEILLREGETSTAGALLVRAMAIAKRNRMMLRLNAATTIYARLLQRRGDMQGARRHALISLEMAKTIGYSFQTSQAQQILTEIDPSTY